MAPDGAERFRVDPDGARKFGSIGPARVGALGRDSGERLDWNLTTEDEQALYSLGLDRVNDLADARRLRLVEAEEHLPTIIRALVGVEAIITVGFTYLFGLENARAQGHGVDVSSSRELSACHPRYVAIPLRWTRATQARGLRADTGEIRNK
jgi:hypothetical protein